MNNEGAYTKIFTSYFDTNRSYQLRLAENSFSELIGKSPRKG